jgi:O-antigen ligase
MMWRFLPFYLGLIAAPLLFGGVKPESQAVLGIFLSLGLLLTNNTRPAFPRLPRWLKITLVTLLLLPLVPLPSSLVAFLSPERARLAAEFPIDGQVPQWLTLSTSPARTIQRLWELALAIAAFILTRRHSVLVHSKRNLAVTFSIALILLAASDLWSAQHGRTTVLNIWQISWGKGYGTFANHNHFANWIYVASLFCIGWIIRELFRRERPTSKAALIFVSAATLFALVMAFLSASRSGTIAFIFGLAAFAFLLRSQFKSRSFAITVSVIVIATTITALLAAGPVITRLRSGSTGSTLALKTEIWSQTLRIAAHFPIFGAGPGSFVRVFNHYKTAHGDGSFLHAENDFLELPLELGFPFAFLLFVAFVVFCSKFWTRESPAAAGALAALILFALHSAVEFNSYIPANLILASTILAALCVNPVTPTKASFRQGWPRFAFSIVLSAAFLFLSLRQLAACYVAFHSLRAPTTAGRAKGMNTSIDFFWPYNIDRYITQIRLASDNLAELPRETQLQPHPYWESEQNRALSLDPLNWELRLERTWFQLSYTTNTARAVSNAWLTIRLNPLQGQIPLQFARYFTQRDPDLALQFLAAVHPVIPANHHEALDLAWSITHDPAQLWKLTPNTTNSILNLIHFAQEKKLYAISAQACQALENRLAPENLARLYLEANRPTDTLRLLQNQNTVTAQSLRVQALAASGRHAEAVAAAQLLFSTPAIKPILERKLNPTASYTELLANHQAHSNDPAGALLLAEKCATLSPPNLQVLSNLATQFPTEPRVAYLLFQVQTNLPASAAAAATLAERFVPVQ